MTKNVLNSGTEAVTNVEDALALSGGFGRFQLLASLVIMGNFVRSAFFYYPLPYMELFPAYTCTSEEAPGTSYECEPKDFCNDPNI
jgi:hypothetical protein